MVKGRAGDLLSSVELSPAEAAYLADRGPRAIGATLAGLAHMGLIEFLNDGEVVLASAVHALASVLPIELDPAVIERLLGHPSARVQRSVRDLVERAKREARH